MTSLAEVAQVVAPAPADTSVQVLNLWALVLLTFTNLGATVWNILSGPSKRNAAELKGHTEALAGLDRRVASLEDAGKTAPNLNDFHDLEVKMARMTGAMDLLNERLKPLEKVTERLQEWALEHKNK